MKSTSGKKLCKILEKHGWRRKGGRGSHRGYIHPDFPGVRIVVPWHANRDLKAGLLRALLKRAGLTEDDLEPDPPWAGAAALFHLRVTGCVAGQPAFFSA
jgi:predicted RNA binding protein YcfA (HicA-like mRNA interferase family)